MSNDSCAEREEGETPRTLSAAEVSESRRCWQGLSTHESAPWLLRQQSSCRCHPTSSRSHAGSCPPARQMQLNSSKKHPWGLFKLRSPGFSQSKMLGRDTVPDLVEGPTLGLQGQVTVWQPSLKTLNKPLFSTLSQKLQKYLVPAHLGSWFPWRELYECKHGGLSLHDGLMLAVLPDGLAGRCSSGSGLSHDDLCRGLFPPQVQAFSVAHHNTQS